MVIYKETFVLWCLELPIYPATYWFAERACPAGGGSPFGFISAKVSGIG